MLGNQPDEDVWVEEQYEDVGCVQVFKIPLEKRGYCYGG